jgi:hypothetical protein
LKYTLQKPIPRGESTPLTELTFRDEVCAGDFRGISIRAEMLYDEVLRIASRLCAQPEADLQKMSFADMTKVMEIVGGFLGGGPKTGTAA